MISLPSVKRGFMFPVIIMVFIVFVIVGMAMISSGNSEYMQTAVVTYGLVANQLTMGVVDEIQAIIYDKVNNIDPAIAKWRPNVLSAATNSGTKFKWDFVKNPGDLKDSPQTIQALGGKLLQAQVTFSNFRPFKYATLNTYDVDQVYYHNTMLDSLPVTAPGGPTNPRDFLGYYQIEASVQYGNAIRYYSIVHDIKVVDLSPPAREFVVYAFNIFQSSDEAYLKNCLTDTNSGAMHFYANDVGRVYIRGPYFINVGDETDGAGGRHPPGNAGATIPAVSNSGNDWWNWSLLPVYHEGLINGLWDAPPARPDKTSDTVWSLNFVGFDTSGDAGACLGCDQAWYVGTVDWGKGNFSIFGDPTLGASGWHCFRGLKNQEDDKGQLIAGSGAAYTDGISPILNSQDPGGRYVIQAEPDGGGLVANYNVAQCSWHDIKVLFGKCAWYGINVDKGKNIFGTYGLRWENKREGQSGLLGTILDVVSVATLGFGIAAAGAVTAASVLTQLGKSALEGLAANAAASLLTNTGALPPTGVSADQLLQISQDGYWPPNFKPYAHCATRNYKTLDKALSAPGKPLLLDGTIMVDTLNTNQLLTYKGKGVLCTFANGANANNPAVQGSATPPPAAGGAALKGGVLRDSSSPDGMLTVCAWSTGDPTTKDTMLSLGNPGHENEGCFMAAGGVLPSTNRTAIRGNMVCLALNKNSIPGGNSLEVLYDKTHLAAQSQGGKFDPASYMMTSVTPKIALITDKFIQTAGGITGQGNNDVGNE